MNRLGLIDGDYLLYVATNPDKELDQEGQPVKKDNKFVYLENNVIRSIEKVNTIIIDILDSIEAECYLGFLTGGSFRYKINQDYKANRKDRIRPKYLKVIKEYLIDEWKFYQHNELEADDLVRIARNKWDFTKELSSLSLTFEQAIIVSNDKDILNLEGLHYNPQKKQFVDTNEKEALDYFWKSMIIGDQGDNIHGLRGKGEKFVEKLLIENLGIPIESIVFNEYIQFHGEKKGIEEFYKNYRSLLILDEYKNLELPEPIKYIKNDLGL